jgi:hypothetical protein
MGASCTAKLGLRRILPYTLLAGYTVRTGASEIATCAKHIAQIQSALVLSYGVNKSQIVNSNLYIVAKGAATGREAVSFVSAQPRVLNKRSGMPVGAAYVGRPSRFGNPFVIGRHGDRAAVVARFEAALLANPALLRGCEGRAARQGPGVLVRTRGLSRGLLRIANA